MFNPMTALGNKLQAKMTAQIDAATQDAVRNLTNDPAFRQSIANSVGQILADAARDPATRMALDQMVSNVIRDAAASPEVMSNVSTVVRKTLVTMAKDPESQQAAVGLVRQIGSSAVRELTGPAGDHLILSGAKLVGDGMAGAARGAFEAPAVVAKKFGPGVGILTAPITMPAGAFFGGLRRLVDRALGSP
jgi:hypothetical protein